VLVQEFIGGREINLAIVGNQLLPPAEIDFSTLPEGLPPIVSYAAKWHDQSPEFSGTVPICPAPLAPEESERLQRLAARAWRLMDGTGYARVDIRLTDDGTPYVIDINPNPDLSLDAGLARQARVAGWSYEELIGRITDEALEPSAGGAAHSAWTFVQPAVEPAEAL
jgi:D-alanine-D-alanine ligase